MLGLDVQDMKKYIEDSGIKQKNLAEKAGLNETKLCLALQGKRKLEASEYANICRTMGVPMQTFLKSVSEKETQSC